MTKEDCYFLGKITKPHGLKGGVILWLDVDEPTEYQGLDSVLIDLNGDLVPHFIDEINVNGKKSIAKFEGFDTIEEVEELINKDLYLPIDTLPEMGDQGFYYHEVVGYKVYDKKKELGDLKMVYEGAGQDLFAINVNDKEVLVPIVDSLIVKVDKENKCFFLDLPEGLLEIYLNE